MRAREQVRMILQPQQVKEDNYNKCLDNIIIIIAQLMSNYSSDPDSEDYDEQSSYQLFRFNGSLVGSIETLNNWQQNIGLPYLDYMSKQVHIVEKEYDQFLCGNQIRALAFCKVIRDGLKSIKEKYVQAYQKAAYKSFDAGEAIKIIDQELEKYIRYLHITQLNNVSILYEELDERVFQQIYSTLIELANYCFDINTLWLLCLTPRMFKQEKKQNLYKLNFGGSLAYYQKQLSCLKERVKQIDDIKLGQDSSQDRQVIRNISLIINHQKLKGNLKTKLISLVKGKFYAEKREKSPKDQFILSSFQMYNGEEISEIWDYETYESMCLEVLKAALTDSQYLDYALYMQPQNIPFSRRKRTLEFAELYYSIIYKLLELNLQNSLLEQNSILVKPKYVISDQFIMNSIKGTNSQLLFHSFVNFLLSSKNALSMNSVQLDKMIFGLLEGMKRLYLSFGTSRWILPTTTLMAISTKFFAKFSEDIKDQIMIILPKMVKHFGEQAFPTRLQFCRQEKNGKIYIQSQAKHVTPFEYLSVIFYFIKDAQYKDNEIYIQLPQIAPKSPETAIMFVKSLELKLRHHEPTEDQKNTWSLILEQLIKTFKIKVDLRWFKVKKILDVEERQSQFMFQKQISEKWASELLQQVLNFRDKRIYDSIIQNSLFTSLQIESELISYLKFSVGLNFNLSQWSSHLNQYEIFRLLDRMKFLLQLYFNNIFKMSCDQEILLNQLRISLMLYNLRVQQAKGNQVYKLIVDKIVIPWYSCQNKEVCEEFLVKYSQFFSNHITRQHYLQIGDCLIESLQIPNNQENQLYKISYYLNDLHSSTIKSNIIDLNAEFLQKIYSVFDESKSTSVIMSAMLLILRFIQFIPELQEHVSLGFFIDLLNQGDKSRITSFMKRLEDIEHGKKIKLNFELIKSWPQKIQNYSQSELFQMLSIHLDSEIDQEKPDQLVKVLNSIEKGKMNLLIAVVKALLAERNRSKGLSGILGSTEQQKGKNAFQYWKELEMYNKDNQIERKEAEQEVNLAKICQLFEENTFIKIKQDYKKILLTQHKKKRSSKKKSGEEVKQTQMKGEEIQTQYEDQLKEARIWRKIVRNFGTFEDIILFGEDPLELGGNYENQIYTKCLKIIEQKTIQQKHLKRLIRKLPILEKCAEQAVKNNLQKEGQVQAQLICKLIMINSRYRSNIVEEFILKNISKVPIPIKIYQDYLVTDIRKRLEDCPRNILQKMYFEELGVEELKKIDAAFEKIVYMPIKKFQNIYLKFQSKIQQNVEAENEGWQTQSDKQSEQSDKKQDKKENNKKSRPARQIQSYQCEQLDDGESNEEPLSDDCCDGDEEDQGSDQDVEDEEQEYYEEHGKIVQMFYQQESPNLRSYKFFIQLRQQINIAFESNYQNVETLKEKVRNDPQLEKKLFKIVSILEEQINQSSIKEQIVNKIPNALYILLQDYGLTVQRSEQKIIEYRKEITSMPKFIEEDQEEDRDDQYSNSDYQDNDYEEYDDDELSREQSSENDMFDGLGDQMMFSTGQDHIEHINAEQLTKINENESEQEDDDEIKQKIQLEEDSLSLPQLRQINSKIETELTGKQFSIHQMALIMQIAIVKLYSLNTYQLKQKPITSFYSELIKSKQGKIFIDTIMTVFRVDENYGEQQRYKLSKKLSNTQFSISKALNNFLEIAVQIMVQNSKDSQQFALNINDEVQALLPIGDEIVIKSDIPVQDNYLSLLLLYSRFKHSSPHEKLKRLLSMLTNSVKKPSQLTKKKAAILTKHIYNHNNSSSIWNTIEERFGVAISQKVKLHSCLSVYGKLLQEDVKKCYIDLVQIMKLPINYSNEKQKKEAKQIIKQHEKKVQNNLRKYSKRIKHYYYWNKNIIYEDLKYKPIEILKNKELIKLTQLMIFYCHLLKEKFFEKIDDNAMKNLLVLPKSVIQTSFLLLWKLKVNIDKWEPLSKIKQFFQHFQLHQYQFKNLQDVCNLLLEFLEMPEFSNSKFKQIIIPYFINNPSHAHQIPLIFKLPSIPEQSEGQKIYLTRECSFDMAFYQLASKSILVQFHNEQGSDHGGMVREFMMGWSGLGIGQQYIFLGKILAISFKKSIPFGGDFDISMAIAITQHKITVQFFESVDPEIYQSLKYIRDNDPQDLDMKFEIVKQEFGVIKHYPLIENGENITITNQNKGDYLKLFLQKYFFIGREWEISQVCTGFFSIVSKKYAAIFSPSEMIQKIQGQQIRDYTKLKNKTTYEQGYSESSQMIKWFWEIVSEFNQKQMNKFLQFITGAPKVSIYNHKFSFVIEKPYAEQENRLPVAHTCFNTIELPEYKTKQILEKKLIQAMYEGNDNFGIA